MSMVTIIILFKICAGDDDQQIKSRPSKEKVFVEKIEFLKSIEE